MASIFSNGLKLIGTGDSVRKDAAFAKDIDDLCYKKIYHAKANAREKMHIEAIRLFAEGYDFFSNNHLSSFDIWWLNDVENGNKLRLSGKIC